MSALLPLLATLVDFGGTVVIAVTAVLCLWDYFRSGGGPAQTGAIQLRLAQSLVLALSFKTGAGLIRTATITSLGQFKSVAVIIALRFLLGRAVKAEIARRSAGR